MNMTFSPTISILTALFYGVIPPRVGGFYCHDPKLDQEFTQDTFQTRWLLLISLFAILWVVSDTVKQVHVSKERSLKIKHTKTNTEGNKG